MIDVSLYCDIKEKFVLIFLSLVEIHNAFMKNHAMAIQGPLFCSEIETRCICTCELVMLNLQILGR